MSRMYLLRAIIWVMLALIGTSPCFSAEPGRRIALVIGNSAYKHTSALSNPANDAEDMAKTLTTLGFHVTKGLDLIKPDMERALSSFASSLRGAELGLFFYAGHGMQVSGQNHLVPVDAKLESVSALEFETVRLDAVQRIMESETTTNVLILDACRDNPLTRNLARALGTRSNAVGKGLAGQEAGAGTLISYSTQPGNVALDGVGRNSPFAGALIKHLPTEGKDLASILIKVRNDVMAATAKRQVPWEHSALTSELVLARISSEASSPQASAQDQPNSPYKDQNSPSKDERRSDSAATFPFPNIVKDETKSDSVTFPFPTIVSKTAEGQAKTGAKDPNIIFADSFESPALGKHWQIGNEDKEAYLVQKGALALLVRKEGDIVTAPNAFRLNDVNMEDDWDMSVTFRPELSSGADRIQIGFVDGDGATMWATFDVNFEPETPPGSMKVTSLRMAGRDCEELNVRLNTTESQAASQRTKIFGHDCSDGPSDELRQLMDALREKGGTLGLSKRGWKYQASFQSPALKQPFHTKEVVAVRAKGRPAFAVGKDRSGQTSAFIDEFRIERAR